MVPVIYFTAGYLQVNGDIRAETLVPQNVTEDWFHDLAFEGKLADGTRYQWPWGAAAIAAMRALIDQAAADMVNVDQTDAGVIAYLEETRDLVLARARVLITAAVQAPREIVVPRCQTTVTYTEPLACFAFKPHLEYNTGVFQNRSNVLFDMD